MTSPFAGSGLSRLLPLLAITLLPSAPTRAADEVCPASDGAGFLCGLQNPEDLVRIPGTRWIIASGMAPGAGLYLVDSEERTWSELYPGDAPRSRAGAETYGACTSPPDAGTLVTHGLNVRPGEDGRSTLYVVGHGAREAVEVFEIDATGPVPGLTWIGCVMTPDGMEANSVASFSDGSLAVTIPLQHGKTISDALARHNTGAVYRWSPGDEEMRPIEGTELPYPNGVEVSSDGREIYVASSGYFTVHAYANTDPSRLLRRTGPLAFVPDNLRMGENGKLITAGLNVDDAVCGPVDRTREFSLEAFAACPRPYTVWEIDPDSMQGAPLASGARNERFSNITMALPMGDVLWIGSFAGDRLAYRTIRGQ